MGRRKIAITKITHERNRSVTFLKRKNGLFKKAYELGVLCSVDVCVIIFEAKPGQQPKLFEYCSGDSDAIIQRRLHFDGEVDSKGPAEFKNKTGDDDDDDEAMSDPPPENNVKDTKSSPTEDRKQDVKSGSTNDQKKVDNNMTLLAAALAGTSPSGSPNYPILPLSDARGGSDSPRNRPPTSGDYGASRGGYGYDPPPDMPPPVPPYARAPPPPHMAHLYANLANNYGQHHPTPISSSYPYSHVPSYPPRRPFELPSALSITTPPPPVSSYHHHHHNHHNGGYGSYDSSTQHALAQLLGAHAQAAAQSSQPSFEWPASSHPPPPQHPPPTAESERQRESSVSSSSAPTAPGSTGNGTGGGQTATDAWLDFLTAGAVPDPTSGGGGDSSRHTTPSAGGSRSPVSATAPSVVGITLPSIGGVSVPGTESSHKRRRVAGDDGDNDGDDDDVSHDVDMDERNDKEKKKEPKVGGGSRSRGTSKTEKSEGENSVKDKRSKKAST